MAGYTYRLIDKNGYGSEKVALMWGPGNNVGIKPTGKVDAGSFGEASQKVKVLHNIQEVYFTIR